MRILFIVPMHIPFDSFTNPAQNVRSYKKKDGKDYNLPPTDLPLGVLSLSAYLKKHIRVDVDLIDFNIKVAEAESFPFSNFHDYVLSVLQNVRVTPDIIGISSLFSPSYQNFLETAAAVRERFPEVVVIGGGNIPTSAYREIYTSDYADCFDALCFGEGEAPLLKLLQAPNMAEHISTSKSWITKDKINSNFEPEHDFIWDLDEIPFYDYDLCDVDKHNANLVVSSFAVSEQNRSFHVMTSRGCPFKCTFCASHAVHGRKMRYHSIERMRKDFTILKEKYKAKTLIFQDDHFMAEKDRVYQILDILRELGLQSIYQSGLALYALDRPMLEAFYAAGVRQLVLAVESGSQRVLKELMKKPLKFEISQRVANDCRELGIYTNANILIGMPGETAEDIEDARRNLKEINANWFHINCASPLVGSEMHSVAKKGGFIKGATLGSDYKVAAIETDDFSLQYIQDMQYIMNLELNFVYNNDIKNKAYDVALRGFENVIKIKSDHAFAYYYAVKCCDALGYKEKAENYKKKCDELIKEPFWKRYAEMFGLELSP